MNDLKFALCQLLKNAGSAPLIPGESPLSTETLGQIQCGFRSRPISNHRRSAGPPHGNHDLSERTRLLSCPATVQGEAKDAPDWLETFDTPRVRSPELLAAGRGKVPKTFPFRWTSRVPLKFLVGGFSQLLRMRRVLSLDFIQEFLQRRARTRVPNDTFPLQITVQFGQDFGQPCEQFIAFFPRQSLNCRRNLVHRAHPEKVGPKALSNKSDFARASNMRFVRVDLKS
jgi:hypothetical protein